MSQRTPARVLLGSLALACCAPLMPAGCGWMSDDRGLFVERRDDYLDAKEGPEVVVPEDLSGVALGDPFPIPETPPQSDAEFYPFKPPLPDAIYGDDKRESVRIQSLGDRRWLVVPEAPATVWPKIKQFFTDNGVSIAAENPESGRLNSQWLPLSAEAYRDIVRTVLADARGSEALAYIGTAERVLLRVEQGLQGRTSEVHLRHQRSDAEPPVGPQPRQIAALSSASTEAEKQMLSELGAYIAAKVAEQTVSMVGQSISTQPKSVLERGVGGVPALRLNLDFERAWATVGQALANADVQVSDVDEDSARYQVLITEETFTGEEKGFFSRMFSFGSDGQSLLVKVLPVSPQAGTPADGAYWVQVEAPEDADEPVSRELSQELLVLIREYAG
ncbi:MAG: outer membrane protein assembly factor BamC [Pseudomonadales bacterium]